LLTSEQQQQQPQLYQYSVKIEMTAKGLSMPTIHVYSNDMETARRQAVDQYFRVIEDLRNKGLPVASPDFKT
jgi:GH35 family endo-1,4-beta-xylanase